MLKKYPALRFEIEKRSDREAFLYFFSTEPIDNGYEMSKAAGGVATDALVDAGYRIYVISGD